MQPEQPVVARYGLPKTATLTMRREPALEQMLLHVERHLDDLLLLPRRGEGAADDGDRHRREEEAAHERQRLSVYKGGASF